MGMIVFSDHPLPSTPQTTQQKTQECEEKESQTSWATWPLRIVYVGLAAVAVAIIGTAKGDIKETETYSTKTKERHFEVLSKTVWRSSAKTP
jgi:hypothetical protein